MNGAISSSSVIRQRRQEYFCRVPFEKIEILSSGDVFLCCPGWLKKPIGNLSETPLLELWKNGVAKEIRQSMYEGTFQLCDANLCPHLQALDAGARPAIYSPIENRKTPRSSYIETLISGIEGSIPNGPREIVVGFDLTCNLSCPSCRREPIVFRPGQASWQKADKMATELINSYSLIRRLKLAGNGDPFASRIYGRMLQALDAEKYPNLLVTLHTNGLLFTADRWKELQKGQACIDTVEISVDAGSPESYALNRRGGSFDILLERLEFISSLRKEKKLKRLLLSFVVQANNFHEMKDFIQLGRRFQADTIIFSRLSNWGTFPSSVLASRSIHNTDHPRHADFLAVMADPILNSPDVFLGNLSEFRHKAPPTAGV